MITDNEIWHYLAVRNLSAFFKGITGNNNGDVYCLNCLKTIKMYLRIMIIAM